MIFFIILLEGCKPAWIWEGRSALDACVCHTLDVVSAEDEKQDHYWNGVEHRSNQGQVPLSLVLLLENTEGHVQNVHIGGTQVQQGLEEGIPHALKLKNQNRQQGWAG